MNQQFARRANIRLPAYEAIAEAAVRDGKIPGAVAMVGSGSEVLHASAIGPSNRADGRPHRIDDVFMIASMTKAVTSVAGAQLLEQGLFSLDQPAEEVIPDVAEHRVLTGFDDAGKPILRAPNPKSPCGSCSPTPRAIPPMCGMPIHLRYLQVMELPGTPTCKRDAFNLPLVFDPGERWNMASPSTISAWRSNACRACGSRSISASTSSIRSAWTGRASSSRRASANIWRRCAPRTGAGAFRTLDFEISQTPEQYMGGAGLYASAGDYLKFLQMLLNRGAGTHGRCSSPTRSS